MGGWWVGGWVVVESNYRVKPNCQSSVRVGVGVVSWTWVRLGFDNCIERNIFLYDLIIKCYGIREKITLSVFGGVLPPPSICAWQVDRSARE